MADLWKDFDFARYTRLMHAIQSGVAMMQNYDGGTEGGETSPKHLRVGVNSAMLETSAIVQLLVDKGVIAPKEFEEALMKMLEGEVKKYEKSLSAKTGTEVRLL